MSSPSADPAAQTPAHAARVHRRQFLLAGTPQQAAEGWGQLRLGERLYLSHCPELALQAVHDAEGLLWAVLGTAVDSQVNAASLRGGVVAAIRASRSDDVTRLVHTWSGRWLLVSSNCIVGDAAALMGLHYLGAGSRFMASTSTALLAQHAAVCRADGRVPGWYGLDWYPPPGTKYRQVYKLLPDQTLYPATGEVRFFDRLQSFPLGLPSTLGDLVELLRIGLVATVRSLAEAQPGRPFTLALTAGLDSRTSFSVLVDAGVKFDTCTFQHSRISDADRSLPPTIAARHGVPHRFIPSAPPDERLQNIFDRHTDWSVFGADRESYAAGCFGHLLGERWFIRSGCWELARRYFHRKLQAINLDDVVARPGRVVRRFNTFVNIGESSVALARWARWRSDHAVTADWRDLFYRDQRLGGWLSAIEQSLDLADPTSVHMVNGDLFYRLLLAAARLGEPPEALQAALIERCCPGLMDFPVNPDSGGRLEPLRAKAAKAKAVLSGEARSLLSGLISRQ